MSLPVPATERPAVLSETVMAEVPPARPILSPMSMTTI
jgi:hypothetical protein